MPGGRNLIAIVVVVLVAAVAAGWWFFRAPPAPPRPTDRGADEAAAVPTARAIGDGRLIGWWPAAPAPLASQLAETAQGGVSNIHPDDYAGPARCRKCHPGNHAGWTRHAHRLMNAVASEETIKGDFSGQAALHSRGGRATFFRDAPAGRWWMRLARGDVTRSYRVTQTIGSRFYQYYVGRLVSGPEPDGHQFYTTDHVLPFGYWLDRREWVPVVHVHRERPERDREDPFAPAGELERFAPYAQGCNGCHTTFPLGDMFTREPLRLSQHAPWRLHWNLFDYLQDSRAGFTTVGMRPDDYDEDALQGLGERLSRMDAREHAVTLGISCEACHLGSRRHAENPELLPAFAPQSRHLASDRRDGTIDPGRTHANLNWACGRCHAGARSQFAAGMSTWNSIEYTDAIRGACYSELKCIDCHDPHQPIGPRWTRTRKQDEAVCLKCHGDYADAKRRAAHTHHPPGSRGDGCLDCHMPRVNEGLQDVVRTHMIFSPDRAEMLEANHPNACNLCHVRRPVDWTLEHLREWYGTGVDEEAVAEAYPQRAGPVGTGWLHSANEAVRLVAADALTRQRAGWALPELLDALDDDFLLNRQFARKGLEEMTGVVLENWGYRFYLARSERRPVIARLRRSLLEGQSDEGAERTSGAGGAR